MAAAIVYGSGQIAKHNLDTGAFALFMSTLLLMYGPAKKLSRVNANLQQAIAASERIFEMLDTHTEVKEQSAARPLEPFKRVIEKQPKWVFAMNELGIAYRKQNNFKEAAASFRKATSVDGKYVIAYYNLAESEFRAGNLGEAQKAYNKVKELGRRDLATQLQLLSGGALRG